MKSLSTTLGVLALAASFCYAEGKPAKPEKRKAHNPELIFKKLDSNGDSSISLDEFKASERAQKDLVKAEEIFKKIDKDASGGLSLEEFKANFPGHGGHKRKGGKDGKKPDGDAPAEPAPAEN